MSQIRIVRDYPHPPEKVWRALTDPALIPLWTSTGAGGRPEGFSPVAGTKFRFIAKPKPGWNGIVDSVAPVRSYLAYPVQSHSRVPAGPGKLIWPAGPRQAPGQIIKIGLRNVDVKWLWRAHEPSMPTIEARSRPQYSSLRQNAETSPTATARVMRERHPK